MFRRCVELPTRCISPLIHYMNQLYRQWTKPGIASVVPGALAGVKRSRRDLTVENAFLRQQLIVLERQTP